MDEVMAAATVEAVKAVAKDVYEDGAKPAVSATGHLLGMVCKVCAPNTIRLICNEILLQKVRKQLMLKSFLIRRFLSARYIIQMH